jgi:hypothetical protein
MEQGPADRWRALVFFTHPPDFSNNFFNASALDFSNNSNNNEQQKP